jgi:hypothetical protein
MFWYVYYPLHTTTNNFNPMCWFISDIHGYGFVVYINIKLQIFLGAQNFSLVGGGRCAKNLLTNLCLSCLILFLLIILEFSG